MNIDRILWDTPQTCDDGKGNLFILFLTRALTSSGYRIAFYWDENENILTDDGWVIDNIACSSNLNESLYKGNTKTLEDLNKLTRKYHCKVTKDLDLICKDSVENDGIVEMIQAATAIDAYVQLCD